MNLFASFIFDRLILAPKKFAAAFSLSFCLTSLVFLGAGCSTDLNSSSSAPVRNSQNPSSSNPSSLKTCDALRVNLQPEEQIGKINDQPVFAKDLGDDLKRLEDKAWRTYCQSIASARENMFDSYVNDYLVKAAAMKASIGEEAFVRQAIDARMKVPSDEELLAFYNMNKRETDPPLDAVKQSVLQYFQRQQAENAVRELLLELRQGATIVQVLPDMQPPPLQINVPSHSASIGSSSAKVTVVEFADYECPYCATAANAVDQIKDTFKKDVRFVYRHFPLSFHPNAKIAAEYAQCAQAQGAFWKLHKLFYENTRNLDPASLQTYAEQVGLDKDKLTTCLQSGQAEREVADDLEEGRAIGVEGTPSFYINGERYEGPVSSEGLASAIQEALARR